MDTMNIIAIGAFPLYAGGATAHSFVLMLDDASMRKCTLWSLFWPIVTPIWLITWPVRRLLRWRRERKCRRAADAFSKKHDNDRARYIGDDGNGPVFEMEFFHYCAPKPVPRGSQQLVIYREGQELAEWYVSQGLLPNGLHPDYDPAAMTGDGMRKPVPYGSRVPDDAQPVRLDAHRELEARVARLEGARVRAFRQTLPRKPCKNGVVFCSEAMTPGVFLFDGVDMWFRHDSGGYWQECGTYYATPEGLSDAAYSCDELPHAEALALDAERRKARDANRP